MRSLSVSPLPGEETGAARGHVTRSGPRSQEEAQPLEPSSEASKTVSQHLRHTADDIPTTSPHKRPAPRSSPHMSVGSFQALGLTWTSRGPHCTANDCHHLNFLLTLFDDSHRLKLKGIHFNSRFTGPETMNRGNHFEQGAFMSLSLQAVDYFIHPSIPPSIHPLFTENHCSIMVKNMDSQDRLSGFKPGFPSVTFINLTFCVSVSPFEK